MPLYKLLHNLLTVLAQIANKMGVIKVTDYKSNLYCDNFEINTGFLLRTFVLFAGFELLSLQTYCFVTPAHCLGAFCKGFIHAAGRCLCLEHPVSIRFPLNLEGLFVTGFLHYQTGSYGGEGRGGGACIPAPPVARRGSKQRAGAVRPLWHIRVATV
jgi:hypothetical protein